MKNVKFKKIIVIILLNIILGNLIVFQTYGDDFSNESDCIDGLYIVTRDCPEEYIVADIIKQYIIE